MEGAMIGAGQLHFRCSFELRPTTQDDEPWSTLIKTVRNWVADTPRACPPTTNPAFFSSFFFTGGEWRPPSAPLSFVRTARHVGNGSDREPQHWSLRYEHA